MVSRVIGLLYREVRGLHEAAYLLGIFTLSAQVLALVRDRILAHQFGAGQTLDLYYAAFRIPDLVYVIIGSLVSVYVLIPFLTERMEISTEKVREFLSSLYSFFLLATASVCAVVFFSASHIVPYLFPGFEHTGQYADLTMLIRVLLLQPLLLGVSNLFASVTQLHRKFLLYGISPVLYNIGIILGVVVLYPYMGIVGLAWGVVLGAFLHLLIQIPFILSEGVFPSFVWRINIAEVRKVIGVSIPRTLTLTVGQALSFIFISFASFMTAGSIAVFSFAFNLQSVPLAIIGVSYSVAAFPALSLLITKGQLPEYISHISSALRHIIAWSFPVIVLFIVLRAQVVRVVLGTGAFDWNDTRLVAAALALFVLSLSSHGIMLLLVRAYYAAGSTFKPFFINAFSSLVGIASAWALFTLFTTNDLFRENIEALLRVQDLSGTEVLMLPLGYTIGMLINAILLLAFFGCDFAPLSGALYKVVVKSGIASVLSGVAAYSMLNIMDDVVDINTFFGIFAQGFLAGVVGVVVYGLSLYLFKSEEYMEISQALKHKMKIRAVPLSNEQVE